MELTKTQLVGIRMLLKEKEKMDEQVREFLMAVVEENGGDTTKKWHFDGKSLTEVHG